MYQLGICLATGVKAAVLHTRTYMYVSKTQFLLYLCMLIYLHTHTCSAPPISAPSMEYIGSTIQDAFVIAIVTFSVTVSLAQVFANKLNYTIHSNQVHAGDTCTCTYFLYTLVHTCCGIDLLVSSQ